MALPRPPALARARATVTRGLDTARAFRATGILDHLSALGLVRFARDARGQRFGPHLIMMLHAKNSPEREALVGGGRRLTYGQLEGEINQLGHALVARGVGPGDRVALMLPNGPEFVVALQALPRIGAVAAQIGVRLKAGEIGHILENARPRAIVYHASLAGELEPALAQLAAAPARIVVDGEGDARWDRVLADQPGEHPPTRRAGDAGGVIVYTSGTTGKPKGARRGWSQTGIEAVSEMIAAIGMRADDRHLVVSPMYHSGAMAFTMLTLTLGGTCVIMDHFEPEAALAAIDRERITCMFTVPTMLNRLIAVEPEVRQRHDLSSLRWILSGAAPLTTETARRFQALYGRVLWNFYGATETGLVSLAGPDDHDARPGTVGRILRGNQLRILDDAGHEVAPGEVGEVWVKNSMLVDGYHGDAGATSEAMKDGFFSVGDLGRLDADGYLYLASRKHDMVISGGVNIYPAEIEETLATHPDVVEAAVIGVPDVDWGESLAAFVVCKAGRAPSADELVAHCRTHLADYKRPRRIEFVAELPRNPTGKILKRELRLRVS